MESILNFIAAIISILCALYCGLKVSYIKKTSISKGNRNVHLDNSNQNSINTGNGLVNGDRDER